MRVTAISTLSMLAGAALSVPFFGQKPVIDPRGVMNAATLAPAGSPGAGTTGGSIATIFGQNLAPYTAAATGTPLPTSLAGVSVRDAFSDGRPLPLFFVSPGQINFQIPQIATPVSIVVQTPGGTSDPAPVYLYNPKGIFTQDGSGCGPAWIFNVAPDGSWSLNSPENSAEPGGLLVVLGTGLEQVYGPGLKDGEASPSDPPARNSRPDTFCKPGVPTHGSPIEAHGLFCGRAPGLVGVDQYNIKLPDNAIEGCGVPLTFPFFTLGSWSSQPVPINVRRGGGKCPPLPPPESYADFTLEKVTTTQKCFSIDDSHIDCSAPPKISTTERLNVSLSAAVGKRLPDPTFFDGPVEDPESYRRDYVPPDGWISGPSCPFPPFDQKPVDAGVFTIAGPNGSLPYAPDPNATSFQVSLPEGFLVPGTVRIGAQGGAGAGPLSVGLTIGDDIQFDNPVPDGVYRATRPLVLNWSGGSRDEVVRIRAAAGVPG